MSKEENVPKIIHYFWFGGKELPELAKKCIASWRKYCPDYEIIEWNESNYNIDKCDYIREAYEAKKWAFVSDYARFDILYHHGGIYFDTDVELLKPIDEIVRNGAFLGIEAEITGKKGVKEITVNPGLGLAAKPGMKIFKEILDRYAERHFIMEDSSLDLTTVVTFVTDILVSHGMQHKAEIQNVSDIMIYPKEYFCPLNYDTGKLNITENTYSIHHFGESWVDEKEKYITTLYRKFQKFLPKGIAKFCAIYIGICKKENIIEANKHFMKRFLKK